MNPYHPPRANSAFQATRISPPLPWATIGAFLGMTSIFFCSDLLPLPGWFVDRFHDPVNPYQVISVLMVSSGLVGALLFDLTALVTRRIQTKRVDDESRTLWFWPIAITLVLAGIAFDRYTFGTPPSVIAKVPVVLFVALAGYNHVMWRRAMGSATAISWSKQTQ